MRRRHRRWICLATLAVACAGDEVATLDVQPPGLAPGEPVRVRLPAAPGAVTELRLLDSGAETFHTEAVPPGATEVWLYPTAHPLRRGPVRVEARRAGGEVVAARSVPLDLGRPAHPGHVVAGLHGRGPGESGPIWSEGRVTAELENLDHDALLHVRYRCGAETERRAFLTIAEQRVELPCGVNDLQTVRVHVPHAAWGERPFVAATLEVVPPFRPADVWGGDDSRELGLQLERLLLTWPVERGAP